MKRIISLFIFLLLLNISAFAHETFTLVGSEKKTVKESDLAKLEKDQTPGKKNKTNLTFTGKEIRIVVTTGPEDDMLSYRIQAVRNPNLVVPSGATLKILFINTDTDMRHDVRFGYIVGEFPIAPDIKETAGSTKLTARSEDGVLQAEEFTIKANEDGAYKYFCSVRGHAKGGMWGNILVNVKPGANMKMPEKKVHIHSADEENEPHSHGEEEKPAATENKTRDESKSHSHGKKTDVKKSDKKPNGEMSDMKMDDKKSDEMAAMNHSNHDEMSGMSHRNGEMSNVPGMNHGTMAMRSVVNAGDPMTRESSGTALGRRIRHRCMRG
jgi:plastocyanin